jgi:hypothetical protein
MMQSWLAAFEGIIFKIANATKPNSPQTPRIDIAENEKTLSKFRFMELVISRDLDFSARD